MASVFNGSGSAFGGGASGRRFGSFQMTNKPQETDFGKYLAQVNDPVMKGQLGLAGHAENEGTQRFALDMYRQFLAEGGGSPALLRALQNRERDLMSAYAVRQGEQPGLRLANFLAELDAPGSWQGWSPYEGGRQQPAWRVRYQGA